MGGCGNFEQESDFLHVYSHENLLINILDSPYEFSEKSGTVGPDEKTIGVNRQKVGVTLNVHNFCYGSPFQAHNQ